MPWFRLWICTKTRKKSDVPRIKSNDVYVCVIEGEGDDTVKSIEECAVVQIRVVIIYIYCMGRVRYQNTPHPLFFLFKIYS